MKKSPEHARDRHSLRYLVPLTLAGAAAAGATLFGAVRKDVDTEAAIRQAVRPAAVSTAKKIVRFAEAHPDLARTRVRDGVATLSVTAMTRPDATRESDKAGFKVVAGARHQSEQGTTSIDTSDVLSVSMWRSGHLRGDAAQTYVQRVRFYGPDIATPDADGWRAVERTAVKEGGVGPEQAINTNQARDPVRAAEHIAADAPSLFTQVELDLDYIDHPDTRLMP